MLRSKISIVIAEDHPIMLKGLYQEIVDAGFNVVATAINGAKALEVITSEQPKIAIVDLEMPLLNGYEVIKKCKQTSPNTRYIVMTYHKEKGFVAQAKKLGALGYILKEDHIDSIIKCIETVNDNKNFLSPSFNINFDKIVENELRKLNLLTASERSILRLIAKEKSSKDISELLLISIRTVQKHRTNIISKLEINQDAYPITFWIKENKELLAYL